MCTRPPLSRASLITIATAAVSLTSGRDRRKLAYVLPSGRGARRESGRILRMHDQKTFERGHRAHARASPASSSGGNSGTPESARKHLKPNTPA